MRRRVRPTTVGWLTVVIALSVAIAVPALATGTSAVPTLALRVRSQSFAIRYYQQHPDLAPDGLTREFEQLHAFAGQVVTSATRPSGAVSRGVASLAPLAPGAFNLDTSGLPQNEESGAACRTNPLNVLQGSNDYRGLVSPTTDLTGYSFSNDGGATVKTDGQLPSVTIGSVTVPSGGDPVDRWSSNCTAFASDIDFAADFFSFTQVSAIVVRSSTATTLGGCTSPATCWPTAKVVDSTTAPSDFLDKDWMDVGKSGANEYVWVTYTKFSGVNAFIDAVRCNLALTSCTAPIQVSDAADTTGQFPQGSYVTIGPDGRVYVAYATYSPDATGLARVRTIKIKIAPAGSTVFGPAKIVATPTNAIALGAHLQADDFRVGTMPKMTVAMVGAAPRIFVTDEECSALVHGICEAPRIKLRYSDDDGTSWTTLKYGTFGSENYFPTVATDTSTTPNTIALAWYTNGNDPAHHRYDVALRTFPADLSTPATVTKITTTANEPDADPVVGGQFIGDYFEVFATGGNAYVNFNQNQRAQQLVHSGLPVLQQDNYLAIAPF